MEKNQVVKTKKKPRHAAKPWDFKMRGGIDMVNTREIAETLSRKNPVAVVTLLPFGEGKDSIKKGIIIIHHSLLNRYHGTKGLSVISIIQKFPHEDTTEEDAYAYVVLSDINQAAAIIEAIAKYRQNELLDKQEYMAVVNYPII